MAQGIWALNAHKAWARLLLANEDARGKSTSTSLEAACHHNPHATFCSNLAACRRLMSKHHIPVSRSPPMRSHPDRAAMAPGR